MARLLVVLALVSCSAPRTPPSPPVANVAPAPTRTADGQVRPEATAGLYWLPYVTCHDCQTPVAIVAYVTPDPASARRIARALDGTLALGLPYIIHTDELGIAPSGIAIVTGTYSSRSAAATAAATTRLVDDRRATVFELAADAGAPVPEAPRHVTVVDRGPRVMAWSRTDLDAVEAALETTTDPDASSSMEAQRAWIRRKLREHAPACTVQPGDLFVVEERELEWYAFAPVRCGTTLAYIDWTSSLLGHAVVVPDGTGHRLFQIVGAECDSPIIESWSYDASGRRRAPESDGLVASSSGC